MSKKRQQVTAVIYDKRGRVLSVGQNSYIKTHPLQAKYARQVGLPKKLFLHAEIHAIVRCRDITRADSIFISRWDSSGRPMLAEPCEICASAIRAAGIRHVRWTG